MIQNKSDLKKYLEQDKMQLGRRYRRPHFLGDEIWKFQIALRMHEYYLNTAPGGGLLRYWEWKHHRLGVKLGFTIPCNVFGPGLNIHHYGCIVVNAHARVGENCNLQQMVNIGQNHGKEDVPIIGDNVYIGPGAKIFGQITIANGVAIGANSVVNHSCHDENVTLAGAPAKVIGRRKISSYKPM